MKNKLFIIIAIAQLLIIVAVSCNKEPVQGVNIEGKLVVMVGETATLTPTFVPPTAYNQKVSWESNDTNVATVENGLVTGLSMGRATITVKTEDGGRTAKCYVSVIQPVEPEEMIWVEGGTFMMGCNEYDDECTENELPRHEVTLKGFYISKYMVTQKEWMAAMGSLPSSFFGDNYPAFKLDWEKVQEYINKLNAFTGKNYRLPTEAEWEYAARGGNKSKGYKYSGSNNFIEVAWCVETDVFNLHSVGQKKPNELGIYDMSGNILELCSDYYGAYSDVPQINPSGPATGIKRVQRGGACFMHAKYCRVSYRFDKYPYSVTVDESSTGIRLVHP
jgi:formylglycine-generating enzyme required for sulfatase activity